MGFRLVLLGLVASLGFELPTRQGLEGWSTAAQTCLNAALDEWNAWVPTPGSDDLAEAETPRSEVAAVEVEADDAPPAVAEDVASTRMVSDEEFAAVVEEMVAGFESAEFAAVVDQIAFDLASADAEFRAEPAIASAPLDDEGNGEGLDEVLATEPNKVGGDAVAEASSPAPAVRLARAVRLTGEALTAWANVLEGRTLASLQP